MSYEGLRAQRGVWALQKRVDTLEEQVEWLLELAANPRVFVNVPKEKGPESEDPEPEYEPDNPVV